MDHNHAACQALLKNARENAKRIKVEIPKKITSHHSFTFFDKWFILYDGDLNVLHKDKGCCSFKVRAKFIMSLIKNNQYKKD